MQHAVMMLPLWSKDITSSRKQLKFSQTVATESETATKAYGEFVTEIQKHYKEAKDEYKNQLHDFPGA